VRLRERYTSSEYAETQVRVDVGLTPKQRQLEQYWSIPSRSSNRRLGRWTIRDDRYTIAEGVALQSKCSSTPPAFGVRGARLKKLQIRGELERALPLSAG
jgi:hypothetical protein